MIPAQSCRSSLVGLSRCFPIANGVLEVAECGATIGLTKVEMVRHFRQSDKPIAAICHGAQVLAAAGVLEDKACSAYPAVGPEIIQAGGRYMDIPVNEAHVDGRLVTAPAWPAHPDWLAKFLHVLGTKIEP